MSTDAEVLGFWFGPPPLATRAEWFRKDPAFDDAIRARFGAAVDAAIHGRLPMPEGAEAVLARLILLDQFPRNLFRGQARAFAGDPAALALALDLLDRGDERRLHRLQRWFVYPAAGARRGPVPAGSQRVRSSPNSPPKARTLPARWTTPNATAT